MGTIKKQKDKELLLKDLCPRLPYNCRVFVEITDDLSHETHGYSITLNTHYIYEFENDKIVIKPYLRPLSSMTEEEILELYKITYDTWYNDSLYYKSEEWISFRDSIRNNTLCFKSSIWASRIFKVYDWLNSNNFDYNGLIPMGLGIDCTETNIYDSSIKV